MTDREAAWDAVHEALPAGWTADLRPGRTGMVRHSARSVAYSRGKPPQTVTGTGVDETAALRTLDDRLRGVPQPDGSRMAERERRFRLAYMTGPSRGHREKAGRGLTESELDGVVGGAGLR